MQLKPVPELRPAGFQDIPVSTGYLPIDTTVLLGDFGDHIMDRIIYPALFSRSSQHMAGESDKLILDVLQDALMDNTDQWKNRPGSSIMDKLKQFQWATWITSRTMRAVGSKALTNAVDAQISTVAAMICGAVDPTSKTGYASLSEVLADPRKGVSLHAYLSGLMSGEVPALTTIQNLMLIVGQGDTRPTSIMEFENRLIRIQKSVTTLLMSPGEKRDAGLAAAMLLADYLHGTASPEAASLYFYPLRETMDSREVTAKVMAKCAAYAHWYYSHLQAPLVFTQAAVLHTLENEIDFLVAMGYPEDDSAIKQARLQIAEIKRSLDHPSFKPMAGMIQAYIDSQRQFASITGFVSTSFWNSVRDSFSGNPIPPLMPAKVAVGGDAYDFTGVKLGVLSDLRLTAIASEVFSRVSARFSEVRAMATSLQYFELDEMSEQLGLPSRDPNPPRFSSAIDEVRFASVNDDFDVDLSFRKYDPAGKELLTDELFSLVRTTPWVEEKLNEMVQNHLFRWVRDTRDLELPHPEAAFSIGMIPACYSAPYTPLSVMNTISEVDRYLPRTEVPGGKYMSYFRAIQSKIRSINPRKKEDMYDLAQAVAGMGYFEYVEAGKLVPIVPVTETKLFSSALSSNNPKMWVYGMDMATLISVHPDWDPGAVSSNALAIGPEPSGDGDGLIETTYSNDPESVTTPYGLLVYNGDMTIFFRLWEFLPRLRRIHPVLLQLPGGVGRYVPSYFVLGDEITEESFWPVTGWSRYIEYWPHIKFSTLRLDPPSASKWAIRLFTKERVVGYANWPYDIAYVMPGDGIADQNSAQFPSGTAPSGSSTEDNNSHNSEVLASEQAVEKVNAPIKENKDANPTAEPTPGSADEGGSASDTLASVAGTKGYEPQAPAPDSDVNVGDGDPGVKLNRKVNESEPGDPSDPGAKSAAKPGKKESKEDSSESESESDRIEDPVKAEEEAKSEDSSLNDEDDKKKKKKKKTSKDKPENSSSSDKEDD